MNSTELASPDKQTIRRIFDAIANRYDFLNSFLSLKLDERWRSKSKDLILEDERHAILDLGTGTGKWLQSFLAEGRWDRAAGLDFSSEMLNIARQYVPRSAELINADFHDLPFRPGSFDLAVSSFTLRSVKDMPRFLKQVYELLKPGGKVAFLDLTRPKSLLCKLLYYPYLNIYLPLVGRMVSGDAQAYQFLSKSIQSFQDPEETMIKMSEAGFQHIRSRSFTLGAATLIVAVK